MTDQHDHDQTAEGMTKRNMRGVGILTLRWMSAILYGLMGALIGVAVAFLIIKILLLLIGSAFISVKMIQVLVISSGVLAALAAGWGFLRK